MGPTAKRGERAEWPGTLPAVFAVTLLDAAVQRGAPRGAPLAAAQLGPEALTNLEAPLPLGAIFALWESAMRHLRDDGLPVAVAQRFALEDYPVLGFVVMTASTAREALARVVRFHALVSPSA